MIGAIHKISWKFSCYQCYVICFCDCSKLITAFLFNLSLFRLLVVVFHLSVLLRTSSYHFNFSPSFNCYISTKNVYQVKHGKPQLPKRLEEKHILILKLFNNLDAGHYLLFIAETLATPKRIFISFQSVSYPQQFMLLSN